MQSLCCYPLLSCRSCLLTALVMLEITQMCVRPTAPLQVWPQVWQSSSYCWSSLVVWSYTNTTAVSEIWYRLGLGEAWRRRNIQRHHKLSHIRIPLSPKTNQQHRLQYMKTWHPEPTGRSSNRAGHPEDLRRMCICSVMYQMMEYTITIRPAGSPSSQTLKKKKKMSILYQMHYRTHLYLTFTPYTEQLRV